MSYTQIVLADKPAAFWMITAASGTSETDLSGNGKTATITEATDLIDRVYRPLVTGTSTDVAYRFYSYNHKLSYPALELWEANRDHIPFSIEFTFQPITSTAKVGYLFNPQETGSSYVPDNGIYTKNNILFFVTSNGSSAAPATKKTVVSYQLPSIGQTYHVIATYSPDKMSLYVDGKLVDSENMSAGQLWSHTNANYITQTMAAAADAARPEFLLDAVSIYRNALTNTSINNHYVYSTPNFSDLEIVNGSSGKLIKINDEDRVKNLDFSAKDTYDWQGSYVTLTDAYKNGDGVSLKTIDPLKIMTTPRNYTNLLTVNQATFETDLTGWANQAGTIANMTRSTATFLSGSASLLFDCILAGTAIAYANTPKIPVTVGLTYTAVTSFRLHAGAAPGNVSNCKILWYDDYDNSVAEAQGSTFTPTGSWQQSVATAVAPVGATFARIQILARGLVIGNQVAFDNMAVYEGAFKGYAPPLGTQRTLKLDQDVSSELTNLLSYNQATVEVDTTGLAAYTNCTVARSTAQSQHGTASLALTATTAANMASFTAPYIPIVPGRGYTASTSFRAATVARDCYVLISWRNAAGTFLSSNTSSTVTNSTSGWTTITVTGVAPLGATQCDIREYVVGPAISEVHYVDQMGIWEGSSTTTTLPRTKDTDEIKIYQSEYGLIENFGEHTGTPGGFGGNFTVTTAENDNVAEQVVACAFNSTRTNIIEVVKKADKALYLRYIANDTSGVQTIKETSWGAISSLLDTQVYFYVEFANDVITLYINTTASPAIVQVETLAPPQFDAKAQMLLGAGWDKTRCWDGSFAWIKIYNKIQDIANFTANKTSVNGYTLKMNDTTRLNVSQQGTVLVTAPTGADGSEATVQTRVKYWPEGPNIVTTSSINGTTYNSQANDAILVSGGAGTLTNVAYVKSILSTDDSINEVTRLEDISVESFADYNEFGENTFDYIVPEGNPIIYSTNLPMIRQKANSGALITATPDLIISPEAPISNGVTSVEDARFIKTLEFWYYPKTQGYVVASEGPTEYSLRYYDSGGFTRVGFTALYVDGVSVANAATSTTWYNRWHHIVLTSTTAIPIVGSLTATPNLLSVNQASLETDTTGWSPVLRCTIARAVTQSSHGGASLAATVDTAGAYSQFSNPVGTRALVTPGNTYTLSLEAKGGAASQQASVFGTWYDGANAAIVNLSSVSAALSTTTWTQISQNYVAPAGAASVAFTPLVSVLSGSIQPGAVMYFDKFGVWGGTSTTWSVPGATKLNIGKVISSGTFATGNAQNVSYYSNEFSAGNVTTNYKAYLGDNIAASIVDNPGGRTLVDNHISPNPFTLSTTWDTVLVEVD